MFQFYKEKKCLFECRLRFASGISKCIPWDYPQPEGLENEPFCTSHAVAIFEREMDNVKALEGCDCLPDCNHVTFNVDVSLQCPYIQKLIFPTIYFKVNILDLHVKELCNQKGNWANIDMVMKDWQLTNSPVAYWFNNLAGSDARHWSDVRDDFEKDSLDGKTNLTYGLPKAS